VPAGQTQRLVMPLPTSTKLPVGLHTHSAEESAPVLGVTRFSSMEPHVSHAVLPRALLYAPATQRVQLVLPASSPSPHRKSAAYRKSSAVYVTSPLMRICSFVVPIPSGVVTVATVSERTSTETPGTSNVLSVESKDMKAPSLLPTRPAPAKPQPVIVKF